MNTYSKGMGYNQYGELLTNSDGTILELEGNDYILNVLMFHLLTEPGEYKIDPSIGIGLQSLVGNMNDNRTHTYIQDQINQYFRFRPDFIDFAVEAFIQKTDNPDEIELRITVTGFDMDYRNELLVRIENGRIVGGYDFTGSTEFEVISTTETQSGSEVNPYLSRLAKQ